MASATKCSDWVRKLDREGNATLGAEAPPAKFDADAAMKAATLEPKPSAADMARRRFRPRAEAPPVQHRNQTRPRFSTLGAYDVTHGAQAYRPLPTGKRQPARTIATLGRCDTVVRFR